MFHCDFHDQQELAATNIIRAIFKQLAVRSEVLEYVSGVSRGENKVGGQGPRLPDIVEMLKQAVVTLPRFSFASML